MELSSGVNLFTASSVDEPKRKILELLLWFDIDVNPNQNWTWTYG